MIPESLITGSNDFIHAYRLARHYVRSPDAMRSERPEFLNRFVGELFEIVARWHLQQALPPDQVILSPRETLKFFKRLYQKFYRQTSPNRPITVIEHLFDNEGLEGIYIPDGLRLSKKRKGPPLAVYECTAKTGQTTDDVEYFRGKCSAYGQHQKRFGIFRDLPLTFVVLSDTAVPSEIQTSTEIVFLPYTHHEFGLFVNYVLQTYEGMGQALVAIARIPLN